MPVQFRELPQFESSLRRPSFNRPYFSPHICARGARKLCGVVAFALIPWCSVQSALAQSATPAPESKAPVATVPADPTKPLFELPSAWDAPEPWRTDRYYFQFAYYTLHFHYDSDHHQSYAFDSEYHFKETWLGGQWIVGLGLLQNSFGQFSQYLFGGLVWRPIEEQQPFYVKVTAGLLHGYKGQYQNKVPLDSSGVAPGIIPSVGYCVQRYCGEFALLGFNAALFTIGVTVP